MGGQNNNRGPRPVNIEGQNGAGSFGPAANGSGVANGNMNGGGEAKPNRPRPIQSGNFSTPAGAGKPKASIYKPSQPSGPASAPIF